MNRIIKNNEGFTLIEIIFSIAFLSIVSVILLRLFVVSYEIDNNSDLMDIASLHAINEIENVKAMSNIEEELEIKKYYNSNWELLASEKNSYYFVMIKITKNDLYDRGLYDIKASVVNISNNDEIFNIDTMHYYNYKE